MANGLAQPNELRSALARFFLPSFSAWLFSDLWTPLLGGLYRSSDVFSLALFHFSLSLSISRRGARRLSLKGNRRYYAASHTSRLC